MYSAYGDSRSVGVKNWWMGSWSSIVDGDESAVTVNGKHLELHFTSTSLHFNLASPRDAFHPGGRFVTRYMIFIHLPLPHPTPPSVRNMLSSILSNTQTPHQPLLVICDTPVLPAHPLIRDLVRRDLVQ